MPAVLAHRLTMPPPLPAGPQEERESAHEAFMHALESAKPVKLRMPGMQQFAAAVSLVLPAAAQ
jgi:hypothetical protein